MAPSVILYLYHPEPEPPGIRDLVVPKEEEQELVSVHKILLFSILVASIFLCPRILT
jgi:hypothetical protein